MKLVPYTFLQKYFEMDMKVWVKCNLYDKDLLALDINWKVKFGLPC